MPARSIARWALFLLLLAAVAAAIWHRERLDLATLRQWLDGSGAVAPLLFIAIYALATVLFLPGSVLTLAGVAPTRL